MNHLLFTLAHANLSGGEVLQTEQRQRAHRQQAVQHLCLWRKVTGRHKENRWKKRWHRKRSRFRGKHRYELVFDKLAQALVGSGELADAMDMSCYVYIWSHCSFMIQSHCALHTREICMFCEMGVNGVNQHWVTATAMKVNIFFLTYHFHSFPSHPVKIHMHQWLAWFSFTWLNRAIWIAPRTFGSWQVDEVEDDKKIDAVKWEPFIDRIRWYGRPS